MNRIRDTSKAALLVTHSAEYLKDCNHVVYMKNGSIVMQGTFQELKQSCPQFVEELITQEQEGQKSPMQTTRYVLCSIVTCVIVCAK